MAYFPLRESNLHAIEIICEDLGLKREVYLGHKEWKQLPTTKEFTFGERKYKLVRFTLDEEQGGLLYMHTSLGSHVEFYLQAFEKERLFQRSIISPEDLLNSSLSRTFNYGIEAHIEYAKIRSQAMRERKTFVDFF